MARELPRIFTGRVPQQPDDGIGLMSLRSEEKGWRMRDPAPGVGRSYNGRVLAGVPWPIVTPTKSHAPTASHATAAKKMPPSPSR